MALSFRSFAQEIIGGDKFALINVYSPQSRANTDRHGFIIFCANLVEREMNQHYSSQPLCKVIAQRPPRPSQLRTSNLIGALKRGWNKDSC